jgi:cupin fold WbuC family metalloprotein
MPQVQLLTDSLFRELIERASHTPRRRVNFNFHEDPDDNPHRFLNVFLEGSYVRPHRHKDPPKAEAFLVLEGRMAVILFADDGKVERSFLLGAGAEESAKGVDLPPGLWHTVVALTPHAVCYEVKPGPWNPASDKEFAAWAPEEGLPEAAVYLAGLIDLVQPRSAWPRR